MTCPFDNPNQMADTLRALGWRSSNDAQLSCLRTWCEQEKEACSVRAPSPAVKRLVEAVEAFMEVNEKALECDCDSCQEIFVPMRKALAAVREEMGEEAPTVICTNCADSFPEEELPDADMKGQVVCRKCIEKMALGD